MRRYLTHIHVKWITQFLVNFLFLSKVNHYINNVRKEHEKCEKIFNHPDFKADLREKCETAKRSLASQSSAKITMGFRKKKKDISHGIIVNQAKFEDLCVDLLNKCNSLNNFGTLIGGCTIIGWQNKSHRAALFFISHISS